MLLLIFRSYWRIVFTPPGKPPKSFKLTSEELDAVETTRDPKAALEQLVLIQR